MPGSSDPGFDTLALHAGAAPDPATGARAVPIHLTTSFVFESASTPRRCSTWSAPATSTAASRTRPTPCSRSASPRSKAASARSPRRAARRRCTWRSRRIAGAGSHIVASSALYGGSHNLLHYTLPRFGIATTFVEPGDIDAWRAAIRPEHAAAVRRDARQPRPRRARHPARRRDRPRARPAAAGRLDLHDAVADAARSSTAPTSSTTRRPSSSPATAR